MSAPFFVGRVICIVLLILMTELYKARRTSNNFLSVAARKQLPRLQRTLSGVYPELLLFSNRIRFGGVSGFL